MDIEFEVDMLETTRPANSNFVSNGDEQDQATEPRISLVADLVEGLPVSMILTMTPIIRREMGLVHLFVSGTFLSKRQRPADQRVYI